MYLGVDFGTSRLKACAVSEGGSLVGSVVANYPRGSISMIPDEWYRLLLGALSRLRMDCAAELWRPTCLTISATAPNVLVQYEDGRFDGLLFFDQIAYDLELQMDRSLGTDKWANEVLSKLVTLSDRGSSRVVRWFSTHNYLVWRLTGSYVLDALTASECGSLVDSSGWSTEILTTFDLDDIELPKLESPMSVVGTVADSRAVEVLGGACLVAAGSSDSVATCLGSGVVGTDQVLIYYGTFYGATTLAVPLGVALKAHKPIKLFDWFCSLPQAGKQLEWLRSLLAPEGGLREFIELAAGSVPGSHGVRFVHTPLGLESTVSTAPEATIFGLTLSATRADTARAFLESYGYAMLAFADSAQISLEGKIAGAAGGGAASALWRQIMCDVVRISQDYLSESGQGLGTALMSMAATQGFGICLDALNDREGAFQRTEPSLMLRPQYERAYGAYLEVFGWGSSTGWRGRAEGDGVRRAL